MEVTIPVSLETEKAVLAAILKDPTAFSRISPFITAQSFCTNDHGAIFNAIADTIQQNGTPDLVGVHKKLAGMRILQQVSVTEYLAELAVGTPEVPDIIHHARILYEYELRRTLIEMLASNTEFLHDATIDPFEILEDVRLLLESVQKARGFLVYRSLREEREEKIRDLVCRLEEPRGN